MPPLNSPAGCESDSALTSLWLAYTDALTAQAQALQFNLSKVDQLRLSGDVCAAWAAFFRAYQATPADRLAAGEAQQSHCQRRALSLTHSVIDAIEIGGLLQSDGAGIHEDGKRVAAISLLRQLKFTIADAIGGSIA